MYKIIIVVLIFVFGFSACESVKGQQFPVPQVPSGYHVKHVTENDKEVLYLVVVSPSTKTPYDVYSDLNPIFNGMNRIVIVDICILDPNEVLPDKTVGLCNAKIFFNLPPEAD